MGLISNIKDRIEQYAADQKERREFRTLVNKETLPIRRGAYLKQRITDAVEEGKSIAQQELAKKKAKEGKKKELKDFNIKEPVNQWKPTLGLGSELNMQESFNAAKNQQRMNKQKQNKNKVAKQ